MAKNTSIPDAWDDDWESQADNGGARLAEDDGPQEPAPTTRSERLAKHAEAQRKLWESAEAPAKPQYLPVANDVPLTTSFKPALKLLSRKPAPKMVSKKDPVTGLEQLSLEDDEDDAAAKAAQPTPEEIRLRQQKDREEKQRRYDEARAKIFGDSNTSTGSSASTPGNVTPPQQSDSRQAYRGRGKGRGGSSGGRGGGPPRNAETRTETQTDAASRRPASSSKSGGGTRELYDPNYSPNPGFAIQKRSGDIKTPSPRPEAQAIRAPRGPDASGRGGFGFAKRGDKDG